MRHLKSGSKLNRTASHRKAMLSNMTISLLRHERVVTTLAKAKEVRGVAERMITYGKRGGLHNIRLAARTVRDKGILTKLFEDIAKRYENREGGYTRIIKVGERRGDNALMSIIELVGADESPRHKKKKRKPGKKAVAKKSAPTVSAKPASDGDKAATSTSEAVPAEGTAAVKEQEQKQEATAPAAEAHDEVPSAADEEAKSASSEDEKAQKDTSDNK
ncbi:MAG: 50S ribosomal protein L17 [Chitinivibrionales bacterium]|nr:50S ribosomal protein L17 [Chitinivibrionales bacterium]